VRVRSIVGTVLAVVLVAAAARAEIFEQILVKVNGEIFTKSDLENRQVAMLRQQGQNINPADLNDTQLRAALDKVTPQIMVDVVNEMLLVQRGKELGYRLGDDQFNNALESIKKENNITTDAQFQAALKQEGLTMADLRQNFERAMIIQRVEQSEVFSRVAVTDEEARTYYDQHQSEFTTPAAVTLREILVAAPAADSRGLNVAQDDALRAKAEALRGRIVGGESFERVAAEASDSSSKTNGGLIGPFNVSELSSDLQKLLASMKVGDVSEPIRTTRGYQLFKLESRTETVVTPFDQAREQIDNQVFTDKRRDEFKKYLDQLRSQAFIEWKNDEIKKAYEEGLKANPLGNL
jgi:parvulin-like peptidyl-prolyl isomerase